MKQNLLFDLLPTIIVFFIVSIFWVIFGVSNSEIIYLLIGLILGHIFLDLDHIIYWFYRKPNTEESRIIKNTFEKKDFKSFFKLIKAARTSHDNLIFHHYFFQVSINLISFFIFISSSNTFCLSFLLSINLHLLTDEIRDYLSNPKFLQNWLFAREEKQLSIESLKNYLIIFNILFFIFLFLLVKSKT
ncbi:MAG: hypothetical protein PHP97_02460 [Candidatus Shapirobacteria bacterium]|nr:hypothetical protein [Candidatus Shapirobacteria bacterium]MDD3002297.1 hypothetical protein [Candidatus Shapirobacteria bacterium]MDD4382698.1 hypothetical protein [Candidatus Shapirobacteria bacterium]